MSGTRVYYSNSSILTRFRYTNVPPLSTWKYIPSPFLHSNLPNNISCGAEGNGGIHAPVRHKRCWIIIFIFSWGFRTQNNITQRTTTYDTTLLTNSAILTACTIALCIKIPIPQWWLALPLSSQNIYLFTTRHYPSPIWPPALPIIKLAHCYSIATVSYHHELYRLSHFSIQVPWAFSVSYGIPNNRSKWNKIS